MPNLYEDAEKATAYIEHLRTEREMLQQKVGGIEERLDLAEGCIEELAAQVYETTQTQEGGTV